MKMDDILIKIFIGIIVTIIQYTANKLGTYCSRHYPWQRRLVLVASTAIWVIINVATYAMIEMSYLPPNILQFVTLLSSVIILILLWKHIYNYWSVGVVGADCQVGKGIDYKRSLELVHNKFAFLGIGASKLTKLTNEFEAAMKRCRSDKPIRFLLLKPTDKNLTDASQRAGKDKSEYKINVINSLRTIANMHEHRKFNIQVRFYPERPGGTVSIIPIFRLLFIDNKICLLSYNALGEGGGPELPQLHLVPAKNDGKASASFYYAMERYYESLWEQSDSWDFKEFINNE
ncbi:MAG: hypothetical protein WCO53_07780 [Deltaproteobacteria bacterium]